MHVHEAILTRRSHKQFAGIPVPEAQLAQLLKLAIWAPNHKYTEPWRFCVVRHAALPAYLQVIVAGAQSERARSKLPKIAEIVAGAGAAIVVRQVVAPGDPERAREDYAACACAAQHIQLGAWASGWASYWTTSPGFLGEAGEAGAPIRQFLHCTAEEHIVGVILLGAPVREMPAIRHRSVEEVTDWL